MSDKKITPVTNNESVLEFDPNAGLHRVYDWSPTPFTVYAASCAIWICRQKPSGRATKLTEDPATVNFTASSVSLTAK